MEQFAALAALGRKNGPPRMFGYVQSSASFAGLAVALRASTDRDINQHGVAALPGPPRICTSAMTHMSTPKAAAMLGLGRDAVVPIPVDAEFRMDVAALEARIHADRAAGCHVVCVVANAGDVNTGAIDPIDAIADVCARAGVWLHVDGSYGGLAAGTPRAGVALAALGRADSLSLDPHKWLYAPLDDNLAVAQHLAAPSPCVPAGHHQACGCPDGCVRVITF